MTSTRAAEVDETPDDAVDVPAWFDALPRAAALAIVAMGLAGLPFALVGQFERLTVLVATVVVLAGLVALWARGERTPRRRSTAATVCAALALGIAVTSGAVNVANHSEHLIVDGDPAVYAVTGKLLARTGTLVLPTSQALYGGNETVNYAGSGFYESDGEPTFYPQFLHLLPVVLAVADWVGGTGLVLVVNPVIAAFSLLAFYAFAARLVRPPWALLATASLAVLLPQVHFSRDAFSELPSQLLVFAGLAMLWDVQSRRARGGLAAPFVAGVVLGGGAMARGDAFLYLVPLAAALLLVRAGRTALAVLAGAGLSAAVALLDGVVASPFYLGSLRGPLLQSAVALLLLGGLALVARSRPAFVPTLARRLAWPAAGLTVALAAFAWFVRPAVEVARDIPARTNQTIARLQEAEGLPVDVPRSYDEATMLWLSWYVGPLALALGVLGLAYLLFRVLRGHDAKAAPFVLLVVLVTAVYVWKPAIFPVQYWATRRFLPVSFPGLLLAALLVSDRLWALRRPLARAGAAAAAAAVLVFPLALLPGATLPRNYEGFDRAITQTCGALLPDDVVLFVGGGPVGSGLPQAIRGHCGVVAASAGKDSTPADVAEVAAAVEAAGRRLVLLSGDPGSALAPDAEFRPVFDVTVPTTALELTGRPDEVFPYTVRLFAATP